MKFFTQYLLNIVPDAATQNNGLGILVTVSLIDVAPSRTMRE